MEKNADFKKFSAKFFLTPGRIVWIFVLMVGLIGASTCFFKVDETEQAVITRFGKYYTTLGPGLQFKLPFGIDKSYNVPVKVLQTEQFGFQSLKSGVRNEYKNNITYDVNIHHLLMTENNINYFDTNAKFVPPLRSENDRQSLNKAIINNDNVAITSDHTPISAENKLLPFGEAKAGASGVELLLPLTLLWAKQNQVSLLEAIKKITAIPAKIIRTAVNDDSEKNLQNLGTLNIGGNADLCLFDENESWQICEKNLKSRGKNTPFFNEILNGKVKLTIIDGRIIYSDL